MCWFGFWYNLDNLFVSHFGVLSSWFTWSLLKIRRSATIKFRRGQAPKRRSASTAMVYATEKKLESFIKFILKLVMMLLKRKLKNLWNFICMRYNSDKTPSKPRREHTKVWHKKVVQIISKIQINTWLRKKSNQHMIDSKTHQHMKCDIKRYRIKATHDR